MAIKKKASKAAASSKVVAKKALPAKAAKKVSAKKASAKEPSVWPCTLHVQEDDFSLTCTEFGRFEHLTKRDAGGYFLQSLARKLAREKEPALLKRIDFDSEASMFCAFGKDRHALERLAALLRSVCKGRESDTAPRPVVNIPSYAEVQKLLCDGFVSGLDGAAQRELLRRAPLPELNAEQARHLKDLEHRDPAVRAQAGKRLHSEARARTFSWGHYLSHPTTSAAIMRALDRETDAKARREILCALTWTCSRHLADLRAKPYFAAALREKERALRFLGIEGMSSVMDPNWDELTRVAREDRVPELRAHALTAFFFNVRHNPGARWGGVQAGADSGAWRRLLADLAKDPEPKVHKRARTYIEALRSQEA